MMTTGRRYSEGQEKTLTRAKRRNLVLDPE